jgi:hypothetical protein
MGSGPLLKREAILASRLAAVLIAAGFLTFAPLSSLSRRLVRQAVR